MHLFLKLIVLLFALCGASALVAVGHESETQLPFERPHAHGSPEGHAHLGWESVYYCEGRDALDGDSLIFGTFEMGWEHIALGVWYSDSPEQDFDDLKLSLALTQEVGDFEVYGAYTHLRFPFEDAHDNELGVGVAWSGLPYDLELAADTYYSFEAEGGFTEISVGWEFVMNDQLTAYVSSPLGFNHGYVADGHDGANHIALRVGLEHAMSEAVSLTAHATQSWALDRDESFADDELLVDFFHGGAGVQWTF